MKYSPLNKFLGFNLLIKEETNVEHLYWMDSFPTLKYLQFVPLSVPGFAAGAIYNLL
jgi:hypothetical protein